MDAKILELIETSVREGILSSSWIILIIAVVSAGVGGFFGAYLKKKGEGIAINENFHNVLEQLKAQKELTEAIRYEFEVQLKMMESLQAQHIFVRELYSEGIKEYSSEQGFSLRQAYLLLYQPHSCSSNHKDKELEERLETAIETVMQPLRKYIGILDEETISEIYKTQNFLLKMRGNDEKEIKRKKNDVFNLTDVTRKFVKLDKIAYRKGLIDSQLVERRQEE